ncbi:MAG: hypothetical protein RIR51_287 [Bacteroidota bacterium]|jgi:hypothetical protein
MKNLKIIISLLLIIGLSSCTKKPNLEGFDLKTFNSDPGACLGKRKETINWLKENKFNFQGTSSNDIADILGKPDIQQLADRNQEYYIYFLEKGPHCNDKTIKSNAYNIAFRFSAIGLVTEITFQHGLP